MRTTDAGVGVDEYSLIWPVTHWFTACGCSPRGRSSTPTTSDSQLKSGEAAGLTLHTIDGTIPQLRRALDRSLDAYFEFLPGASDEDKRDFDDS